MWMERELGHPIIHAGRGREYRIAGTSVDGYYEVESVNETQRLRITISWLFLTRLSQLLSNQS